MHNWPPRLTWTLEGALAVFLRSRDWPAAGIGNQDIEDLAELLRKLGFVAEGK